MGAADRWGAAPLDEAIRVGARPVIDFLISVDAPTLKTDERVASFLNDAASGDTDRLRHWLAHGVDVNSVDYDGRSGLMLAAKGHAAAVNTLLGAGADPVLVDCFGGCAILESVKAGRADLVALLAANGGALKWSDDETASRMCTAVGNSDVALLKLYLAAGCRADAGDYDKVRDEKGVGGARARRPLSASPPTSPLPPSLSAPRCISQPRTATPSASPPCSRRAPRSTSATGGRAPRSTRRSNTGTTPWSPPCAPRARTRTPRTGGAVRRSTRHAARSGRPSSRRSPRRERGTKGVVCS